MSAEDLTRAYPATYPAGFGGISRLILLIPLIPQPTPPKGLRLACLTTLPLKARIQKYYPYLGSRSVPYRPHPDITCGKSRISGKTPPTHGGEHAKHPKARRNL